ncbi:MAG TPA: NUDIX domain-containing protein [Candidatus Paceibacterota bacterium]
MTTEFNYPLTGDAAVLAVLVANGKTLVIRQPDRDYSQWKFPGGTVEPGETIYQALVREIEDETGFQIPHFKNAGGMWSLGNEKVMVDYLDCRLIKTKHGTHDQHQFLIRIADERDILYLDGQIRKEDDEETIETRIFEFPVLETMRDFLWKQLKMLRKVKAKLTELEQIAT